MEVDHDQKEPKKQKRREDLVPEYKLLGNEEVEVFNITNAAAYLGMTRDNLQKQINARKDTENPIPTFQGAEGGKETYILKTTLDRMRTIVPKE